MNRRGRSKKSTKKTKARNRRLVLLLVVVLVILIGAVVAVVLLSGPPAAASASIQGEYLVDNFTIPDGITVNGQSISGMTSEEAEMALREQAAKMTSDIQLNISFNGTINTFRADELGVVTNADEIIESAMSYGQEGTFAERRQQLARAATEGVDFELTLSETQSTIKTAMTNLARVYDTPMQDATATFDESGNFTYTPEQTGYAIKVDELTALVQQAIVTQNYSTITAPMETTSPALTEEVLRKNTALIGEYKTSRLGDHNRKYNIEKLAGIVNGTAVMPGETWSINEAAGARTVANGWLEANGITGGRYVPQAGGGVCQVSTTLYNAAILGDIKITERTPHTIPSSYVPLGLDATINTNAQDLKITNDTDYPIYFQAYVDGDTITCKVYGRPLEGYKLSFKSEEQEPELYTYEYFDATQLPDGTPLAPGEFKIWRTGRNKRTATVYKTWKYDDGTTKSDTFTTSVYRSYTEQIYYNSDGGLYTIDMPTEQPLATPTDGPGGISGD